MYFYRFAVECSTVVGADGGSPLQGVYSIKMKIAIKRGSNITSVETFWDNGIKWPTSYRARQCRVPYM
jgi:hypothetical protein